MRDDWDVTSFQEKHGLETARSAKMAWVQAVCLRLQHPKRLHTAKVGRSEEGSNSLRPELAAIASTLQAASPKSDLLYLCDSETALNKVESWIGRGPKASLAKDDNADILWVIIEQLRKRTEGGMRTFLVKIKDHPVTLDSDTHTETQT